MTTPHRRDNLFDSFFRWIDSRYKVNALIEYMSAKVVPQHSHSIFYYIGGITLFLFIVQVASGILLLMYYRATPEAAHKSIQYITAEVHFGWLYRQIHAWGASLMILAVVIHIAIHWDWVKMMGRPDSRTCSSIAAEFALKSVTGLMSASRSIARFVMLTTS